jgi:hypothetical protein
MLVAAASGIAGFLVGRSNLEESIIRARDVSDRFTHGPLDDIGSRLVYARGQIAELMRRTFPGYSACGRCRMPWPLVRIHSTEYDAGRGCFPLCEDCWSELRTPANRMPYYMQLMDEWEREDTGGGKERESVRAAVLKEGV